MQTSVVRLMLCGWLFFANDLCGEPPSSIGKLLVRLAEQLHSEANAPVLVRTSPDASCSAEPIDEFASSPQVRWNEKIAVTLLRYSDDHVCIETYVASDSGTVALNANNYQLALGTVPEATRFASDKRLAFLIKSSSDWGKLLLSVPRVANLKTVESLTSRNGNLQASATRFREQAAEVLGDSRSDSSRRRERVSQPVDSIANKLPSVVYITSLILVLFGVAASLYWVKRNRHQGELDGIAKNQPAEAPEASSKPSVESVQAREQKEASFAEEISGLTNANVSDAYIEVVIKSARVLFEKLERDRDPGSLRKVHQYLAERMAEWRENHPERR